VAGDDKLKLIGQSAKLANGKLKLVGQSDKRQTTS